MERVSASRGGFEKRENLRTGKGLQHRHMCCALQWLTLNSSGSRFPGPTTAVIFTRQGFGIGFFAAPFAEGQHFILLP